MNKMESMAGEFHRNQVAGITRRSFLKRSSSLLGAAVLGGMAPGILPQVASAISCYFNPNKYPTETGFIADGDTSLTVTPGNTLRIEDGSPGLHLAFYCTESQIDAGFEMKPTMNIDTSRTLALEGGDSGVRAGFTDGERQFIACLIERPEGRKVALLKNGGFSNGFAIPWEAEFTCAVRKTATGAELEVNGQVESVLRSYLAYSTRATPTIEFGCYSDAAMAAGEFRTLGLPSETTIPEFPSIALPVAAVAGIMYLMRRTKKQD